MLGVVDSHAGRRLATGQLPACQNLLCLRIELHDDILILYIHEDISAAINLRKLGFTRQRNRCNNLISRGVHDGDVLATAIEGPHSSGHGLEGNPVRISARWYSRFDRERAAIEHHNRITGAVANVTRLAIRIEYYAVGALQSSDSAHRFPARSVQDLDPGTVSHVQAMSSVIAQ